MNMLLAFLRRPASKALPHTQVRYVSATHTEDIAARARRLDKRLELAVYVASTTPEQRRAETEEFFNRMRKA